MAYIQPAQSGNYSDGSTWVGGAVPTSSNSDGPNMNVGGYTITLTSNIDDAAMRILVQGAGAAACTFVTGAYDLNVRDIRVSPLLFRFTLTSPFCSKSCILPSIIRQRASS